ncbi:probable inactive 2-oxoglutarate-dependent dioxygenase AOP2 [Punica granatum]|uniref:Probable inactive 2-oxoglutarate-dependent dioxygenase AOP2 n=1 Tax=Punica granatum TaxID=22663 RepID=A0A218WY54_PUNGR|nr:probable inactive 2-oxoglutarate-dependent dioxygenase AOP2 [Punica granatum]OWM77644.1 hypothetical protein CDL15_Pgr017044 [Punica granatum]
MMSKIPVVEFSHDCLKPGTESWLQAAKTIIKSLEDHGCFIADYKDVSLDLHDTIFSVSKELFDLPHETKIKNTNLKPSHGYIAKVPGTPLVEALNIDHAETLGECRNFTNLMWPAGNDRFCKAAYSYAQFIEKLEAMVMRMVFESYDLEKYYKSYTDAATLLLRFLKYKKPHDVESNINPIAHTDKSFISFLHQNNVRGLEVMTKDGEWFTFEPSPSSFMIMAGDAFVAWSNGRIKACYHRVAVREEHEVRYSLGVFSYQNGMIKTPDELIDEKHPQQFKPFDHVDFLCYYDSSDNRIKAQSLIKTYCGV